MLKRLFVGLGSLAAMITLVGFIGSRFTLIAVGAGTPPPGCFTDMGGLVVCGPNYQPSISPSQLPSPTPIPNNDVVGNIAGTSAPPAPVGVSALFDSVFSGAQGSLLYRNASSWVALAPGTSGQFLETLGSSSNPQWSTPPSAAPAATPSPTASTCISISGSYPYTVGVSGAGCTPSPAPSPQVTPPITQVAGVIGLAIGPCFYISGGSLSLNTSNTACSSNGGTGYWATVLAESPGPLHAYALTTLPAGPTPGACASSFPDAASPSPVPLATPTSPANPLTCGDDPIVKDGTASVELNNNNSTTSTDAAYLVIPNTVTESICSANPCSSAFSIEMVFSLTAQSNGATMTSGFNDIFEIDSSNSNMRLYMDTGQSSNIGQDALWYIVNGITFQGVNYGTDEPVDEVYTYSGSSTHVSDLYINGILVSSQSGDSPAQSGSGVGAIGAAVAGNCGANGRFQYVSLWAYALSAQQVRAHYRASGFN